MRLRQFHGILVQHVPWCSPITCNSTNLSLTSPADLTLACTSNMVVAPFRHPLVLWLQLISARSSRNIPTQTMCTSSLPVRVHRLQFAIPEKAMRAGAGFGAGVHFIKALQVLVFPRLPDMSADGEGMVSGFGISFNFHTGVRRTCTTALPIQRLDGGDSGWARYSAQGQPWR